MAKLEQIRTEEKRYHDHFYKSHQLYQQGSWISKPVPNVLEAFTYVKTNQPIRVLDLGSGVGRNAIEIARRIPNNATITCVDYLESAIEILNNNAKKFDVSNKINGIVSDIEHFEFEQAYDFIIAVSTLEHVMNENMFVDVLQRIKNHLAIDGVACLIINSEVNEFDIHSKRTLTPQFEVNLTTKKLYDLLGEIFTTFQCIKQETKHLIYQIDRNQRPVQLTTNAVTYIVKKTNHV